MSWCQHSSTFPLFLTQTSKLREFGCPPVQACTELFCQCTINVDSRRFLPSINKHLPPTVSNAFHYRYPISSTEQLTSLDTDLLFYLPTLGFTGTSMPTTSDTLPPGNTTHPADCQKLDVDANSPTLNKVPACFSDTKQTVRRSNVLARPHLGLIADFWLRHRLIFLLHAQLERFFPLKPDSRRSYHRLRRKK